MKIRIKVPGRLQLGDAVVYVAMICIFSFAMLEHTSISIAAFSNVKFPLLYISGICLVPQIGLYLRNWKKKKYFSIMLVMLMLCGVLLCSAKMSRNLGIGTSAMRTSVRLVLYLIELFLLVIWVSERQKVYSMIHVLFWYTVVLTIMTDALLLTGAIRFVRAGKENYLVGTKFSVSYLHMNLLALWYVRNNIQAYRDIRAKRFIFLLAPFSLMVSVRVDCMTGVLGCLLLLALYAVLNTDFQKKIMNFTSPGVVALALILSAIIPFMISEILQMPMVSYIVQDVLGRDLTLTGRTAAYSLIAERMQGHWLWGVGYGNGNAASMRFFGIANAQNAQINWALQGGVFAIILIDGILLMILHQVHQCSNKREIMPIVILVVAYIVLGTVETTMNMNYFLWLMLLLAWFSEKGTKMYR